MSAEREYSLFRDRSAIIDRSVTKLHSLCNTNRFNGSNGVIQIFAINLILDEAFMVELREASVHLFACACVRARARRE